MKRSSKYFLILFLITNSFLVLSQENHKEKVIKLVEGYLRDKYKFLHKFDSSEIKKKFFIKNVCKFEYDNHPYYIYRFGENVSLHEAKNFFLFIGNKNEDQVFLGGDTLLKDLQKFQFILSKSKKLKCKSILEIYDLLIYNSYQRKEGTINRADYK